MSERVQHSKMLWYTVGPASLGKERDLFSAGATGIRLTFSYSNADLHLRRAIKIKASAECIGCKCMVVADLAGGKARLGAFRSEAVVEAGLGMPVRLVPRETAQPSVDNLTLPVPNTSFLANLKKGNKIIVGDGSVTLAVTAIHRDEVLAEVSSDGIIEQMRGLTIQGADLSPQTLTPKDVSDLEHILKHKEYDCIALSFVESDDDIRRVRAMNAAAGRNLIVAAKIETKRGLENIARICEAADCLIAARGDLALSIPWVDLPQAVDEIAQTARRANKPWILATQIAEGLEKFTIPTRAEICDLRNWLREGAAGVLLSHETVFGRRPLEAVASTALLLRRWS